MRVYHNSRSTTYRNPYSAIETGSTVTLTLDVWDAPGATAQLRTWIDGHGEDLYAMQATPSDNGKTRFEATLTPKAAGIIWYQFIVTDEWGNAKRYGLPDGQTGGTGALFDWEPPSFKLVVKESGTRPETDSDLVSAVTKFVREECTAHELANLLQSLREDYPRAVFNEALDKLRAFDGAVLFDQIAGVTGTAHASSADDGMPATPEEAAPALDASQIGQAKGRFWCASLIRELLPTASDTAAAKAKTAPATIEEPPAASGIWDGDCDTIAVNAADIRKTLPLFEQGQMRCFAANDDVLGIWRVDATGQAACVLVNRSLRFAHDVSIPLVGQAVSEVIGGYGVPLVNAEWNVEQEAAASTEAFSQISATDGARAQMQRYARPHLYQLGSAILLFHPKQLLNAELPAGLGVLAHITSLPSTLDATSDVPTGTLGKPGRAFVDWLAEAQVRYWQVLPANPCDQHGSPYAGISAFAGNTRLLEAGTDADEVVAAHPDRYREFCKREADWLEPYACFMAIRQKRGARKTWQQWPKRYRSFDPALIEKDAELKAFAETCRRAQFAFDLQWRDLRAYANEHGIKIIGDMPIYVSADSADVWANPTMFQLDRSGNPAIVAGCPPDSFAEEGQVWGNPVYDWSALARDGYEWWLRRLARAFELYDYVRLDHFIGFARYFCIPAGEKATVGTYHSGPGLKLFEAAFKKFGPLPIVAEDLGSITPAVRALGAACGFPGMDIIQFVDGNDPLAGYQPRPGKIAYTGTHDNQTLLGYVGQRYPETDAHEAACNLMRKTASCQAPVCIFPLQDLLGLDDEARMNTPGTIEGNWAWQAKQADVEAALPYTKQLVELHLAAKA